MGGRNLAKCDTTGLTPGARGGRRSQISELILPNHAHCGRRGRSLPGIEPRGAGEPPCSFHDRPGPDPARSALSARPQTCVLALAKLARSDPIDPHVDRKLRVLAIANIAAVVTAGQPSARVAA